MLTTPNNCSLENSTAYFPKEFGKSHWLKVYNLAFDVCLLGVILLAGMTGNVLSFLVLAKDRAKGTTNLILRSLAICDTLFLICCFFFQFMKTISIYTQWIEYYNFNSYLTYFLYGTGMAVRMMRNWTVVLVSLERWVAVCRPLHAPVICTVRKARTALVCIVLISLIFSIPQYIVPVVVTQRDNCTGQLFAEIRFRPFLRSSRFFQIAYRIVCYTLLVVLLPVGVLCVLNFLLIRGVRRASQQRSIMSSNMSTRRERCSSRKGESGAGGKSSQNRNSEVNRLCLGVIAVYIVCEIPAVMYQIVYYARNQPLINILLPISNVLVSLNSGINFFIYVFLGKRFRRHLIALLCGRQRSKRNTTNASSVCLRETSGTAVRMNSTHYTTMNANHSCARDV